jgi:hypothetical protein
MSSKQDAEGFSSKAFFKAQQRMADNKASRNLQRRNADECFATEAAFRPLYPPTTPVDTLNFEQ